MRHLCISMGLSLEVLPGLVLRRRSSQLLKNKRMGKTHPLCSGYEFGDRVHHFFFLLLLSFIFIFRDLVLPHFICFYAFSGGGQTTSGSRFIAPSTVLECCLFVCLFLMLY